MTSLEVTPDKVIMTRHVSTERFVTSPVLERTYQLEPYGVAKPQRFGTLVKALFRPEDGIPDRVRNGLRPILKSGLGARHPKAVFRCIADCLLWVWADIKDGVFEKPAFLGG